MGAASVTFPLQVPVGNIIMVPPHKHGWAGHTPEVLESEAGEVQGQEGVEDTKG